MFRKAIQGAKNSNAADPAQEDRRDDPLFSIVVCSIDETKYQRVVANYERLFREVPFEIIGIHDARSLAEGINRGVSRARGQYLIVSHDDIEILTPDFAERLIAHLQDYDLVGIAGTQKVVSGAWGLAGHPYDYCLFTSPLPGRGTYAVHLKGPGPLVIPAIQALDGVFMAMRAAVARAIPFDESTFDDFHVCDIDFSYSAHLNGYRLAVCRDLFVVHHSLGEYGTKWEEQKDRFEEKFGLRFDPEAPFVEPYVLRVHLEPNMLQDAASIRELSDPNTISRLLARLTGGNAREENYRDIP